MKKKSTIIVGMSGGVDSSVCALLLKQQGHEVIGMFMKNWDEEDANGVCQAASDFDDVRKVCEQIDIPYYGVNFVKEYWDEVFAQALEDFKIGLTPNPDILCNREIKFKVFLQKALELGADFLATGHYCQSIAINGLPSLIKGVDTNKDQTYFLYTINHSILEKVLFPIGSLEKNEVRRIAQSYGLATSNKPDSTGICFIGERNFRAFLSQYIAMQPGNFETLQGKKIGKHVGAAFYTIGQRRGLGIGGPGEAWFVVGKDMQNNIVFIEQGAEHPALYSQSLVASQLSWVAQIQPSTPFSCQAKVRYRQTDQPCLIELIEGNKAFVTFPKPQRAVTPGQSIVFYKGDICLGGGIIQETGPTSFKN